MNNISPNTHTCADCQICSILGKTKCDYKKMRSKSQYNLNRKMHMPTQTSAVLSPNKINESLDRTQNTRASFMHSQQYYNNSIMSNKQYTGQKSSQLYSFRPNTQTHTHAHKYSHTGIDTHSKLIYPIYPVYQVVYELRPKQPKSPLTVSRALMKQL